MDDTENITRLPATSYTRVREDGSAYLVGSRCGKCGAKFVGERAHCGRCGARDVLVPYTLASRGRLYNYTIVRRSYPGITVPFVSAVVDLEDGTSVKGNLLGVEPDPQSIRFGMPVRVVFHGAETANADAAGYVAHFFEPDEES
jgi:uncharacterized protein